MRRAKLLILCLAMVSSLAIAEAETKPEEAGRYYLEVGAGLSNGYVPTGGELPSGRYSGAAVYSFAAGKQFNEHIAMEIELAYRGDFTNNDPTVQTNGGSEIGNVTISSLSSMLNGYYYYYNKIENFKPYVTGGAGASRNKTGNFTINSTSQNQQNAVVQNGSSNVSFAWKLGTGFKYSLDRNFDIDLRYQFVNLGNVDLSNSASSYKNNVQVSSDPNAVHASKLRSHEFLVGIVYKF